MADRVRGGRPSSFSGCVGTRWGAHADACTFIFLHLRDPDCFWGCKWGGLIVQGVRFLSLSLSKSEVYEINPYLLK